MANNSNHIMSRYGKWITNKQKERLRKLYKGYRQSTAGDMRSQYLNARKGMYGVRTTASAYGLGEGYVARKKAQMDSSLAEAGRQYAAQADAAFENNAVRPAANATIQAENERKQREYEEKLRKAREKAAKQAKAQADYERALEEYNRNKDKTDKENAKRLAEYKKAMAKYKKELKNAKQRGEKLDRLPQRQVLHGGQPLPKGLSLSADLHQYEGATSTPKPLKSLPKGKGKGKGKANGRGGLLSTDMYEYESGTGHQPTATSHQGLNNRPVAPKTNYAANQTAIQKRKKAKEAVVGKPTKPILAITDTPVPVPPHIEKDLVAKAEAMKPEEVSQLKANYINSAVEHENLVGDLYNALKPDMNRVSLAQEFNHWVGVAQNTALSPAERKQAAMYASRAAEEYNLQDNGKAHKDQIAMLTQMVNDSHDQLVQQQYLLQQKGVRMSEDEIGFDTGYLRQYGAIPAQANDATYAQAQALGDKSSDLGKQLRQLTKMEYLHSQGLPSGQLSPQMQAFIEENNLGWLIDQDVLDRAPLVGIETAIEEKLKKGGDERTEYLQRKGIDRVQRELSTSNPEAVKRVIGSGDSITHLKKLSQTDVSLATIQAMATGGGHQGKTGNEIIKELEKNLDLPSGYISFNTLTALKQDDASVAFINYCYATGQADLAKQYIFDLTEAANKAAGEKQADKISDYLPKGWKWIPEFMYHLGYGASNAIWGKIDFFRGKTPTRTGAYTQEGIIQNEIERGWSEGKARTWANALTSAGENFTDLAIGTLAGNALGAVGDAIGGTVGNIVGKVAGHAPAISMGWSAAGSAKQEMLKKGYSEKAATIYGIFSGVSEAVLQEQVGGLVGFGDRGAFTKALSGLVNQIPNAAGRTAINAVLDVASEIGQEEFGNILDSVYRSVALGEGNDVYDDFKEQFNETAVTTAISTLLLNALHIPTQIRNERGYSAIADASGMSLNDAKFLLETDDAINGGERVDPNDILRYNELTANLMASMPDNVVKAINDGKMTVADWVTSNEGIVQGKLGGKLTKDERTATQTEAVDHTEALKGKTDEQRRDYLLNAAPTGKAGSAYYTTTNGKAIEFKNLNTTQKANYVLAQKCAKAFEGSVDVVIHDTLPLSNGAMVGSDGKLHIALDVTNSRGQQTIAYWTLAHEVAHALKISDNDTWKKMFDAFVEHAKNKKDKSGKNLYDALVQSITEQYDYKGNSEDFNDELFAHIAERMVGSESDQWKATLNDTTIFDDIINDRNIDAKAKKNFIAKLKDSVNKLRNQFKDGLYSREFKRLTKLRDQLEEAYKKINEAPSIRGKAIENEVRKGLEKQRAEAAERKAEAERKEATAHVFDKFFDKLREGWRETAMLEEMLSQFAEEDRAEEERKAADEEAFQKLMAEIEADESKKYQNRMTPLGNEFDSEDISPSTMVDGTAVNSQAQIPAKYSIRARESIAERTLAALNKYTKKKVATTVTEEALTTVKTEIDKLAHILETEYMNQTDKNGNKLLPEETVLNNNIFNNASYLKDAEPTTECYRQTIYFALNKMVTDKLGRPLTQTEAAIVNQGAIEIGREAPCIYCYSLLDRKAKEAYKLQYLAERETFATKMSEEFNDMDAFKKARGEGFEELYQRYLDREFDPAAKRNAKGKATQTRKDTKNQRDRFNLWCDLYEAYGKDGDYLDANSVRNPDAEIITRDQLYDKYSGKEFNLKERELTDLQTWIQDASQAKKVQTYAAYTNAGRGGILNWSQNLINKLNGEYGLRWYSHADYHPAFVIDNMQQITDAAVRGLKGLMYCKPIEAAKIFAPTGMNINVSCFGKYENGQYISDDRLGANWAEVQKLREQYPNVGAVMVCTTEDMTMWALGQDWIDVVIPLHTVRSGSEFVEAFGLHDFSAEQADKMTDAELYTEFIKQICEQNDIRSSKGIEAAYKGHKSIYPAEHQNDYDTYMAALNERGLTARFERFRKMVDSGEITKEMYMKLVNETRQSESQTSPLKAEFDWNAAEESIRQLPKKGYFDYFKSKAMVDGQEMDVNQLTDRMVSDIEAGKKPNELGYGETLANPGIVTRQQAKEAGVSGIHHQNRATDTEYLSLAEKYRDGTATEDEKAELEKRVEEAAKRAGYKKKVYHGTRGERFNIFDFSKDQGGNQQMFFSDNRKISETYGRNVMSLYINTDNFLTVDADGKWWNAIKDKRTYDDFYAKLKVLRDAYEEANAEFFDVLKNNAKAFTEGRTTDEIAAAEKKSNDALKAYQDFEGRSGEEIISGEASDIGNYAKEHGYAGAVIKNVVDTADEKVILPSTVYIIFDSNRVKSADPVTYDSNGDIIPLSERFNAGNEDIRYQQRAEAPVSQEISSAGTSIKQIPALFKHPNVEFGETNIDIGGGRFDLATNYLAERGTKNMLFDPYNQSEEVNRATLDYLMQGNKADTVTCANVLNVIAEPDARANVILEAAKAIKEDGKAYFMVYEGDGSGEGKRTSAGWQNNRKTADYMGEIGQYFNSVQRKGKLIIASEVDEDLPAASWETTPGNATRYQQRDFRIDFNVPQLDTKALHDAIKAESGTVEGRYEVQYAKTADGFKVTVTDTKNGKTYDRAETVTEGNAKAEAERATAALIRNIKRGKPDSKSRSTAGIYHEAGYAPARTSAVPVHYVDEETGTVKRNSLAARTMIESGWMTDEQAEQFADEVHNGIMSYEQVHNAEARAYAEERMQHPASAETEWENLLGSYKIPSDKELAVGMQLMVNAANANDFDLMLKYGTQLREMLTKAGQFTQAFSLMKKLGAVAEAYRLDDAVQKINGDLQKAGREYKVHLNPDLMETLMKSKPGKEREAALTAIYKDIAKQIPPNLKDALNEYRYFAMLFNTRTHIRNVIGNAVFMPAVAIKNIIGTGIEAIRYGKNSTMKTKAIAYGKQYADFAKESWAEAKLAFASTGNKYRDMMNEIDEYRRHFHKGFGWLDKLSKLNSKALSAEDMIFKQAYYRSALAAELSAKKVDLAKLRDVLARHANGEIFKDGSAELALLTVYENARTRAMKEANVNTYNDVNKFARDLNAFSRNGGKFRRMMVEGLLPFKNTPANIVSRAVEYSPAGFLKNITSDAVKLRKGEIGANEFFDRIARSFSGTAIFGIGMFLAKLGFLKGPLGDDKEDKEEERRGHQAFSIEIGGKSYTLDWMAPVCIPLFTGVALYEMLNKEGNGEHWSQYLMNATTGMLEPITKMSMLEGIENLIDSLAYSDSKLEDAGLTVATSYLTQFVPTFFGQIARTIDDKTRRTYSDKNSTLPRLVDKFVQTVQKKIPFWNQQLQPYVDEWGNEEGEANVWLRLFDNFISPGFRSSITEDEADKEIARLYDVLKDPGVFPSTASKKFSYGGEEYNLTASEYTAFAEARGTTAKALIDSLLDSAAYAELSDRDKGLATAYAYTYANTMAKVAALGLRGIVDVDWGSLGSWVKKANEFAKISDSPTALADFIAAKVGLKSLEDNLGKTSLSREERYNYLLGVNILSNEAKALLMEANDSSDGYAEGTAFYNKNGKLIINFANPGEAAPAEQPATSTEGAAAPAAVPAPTAAPAAQPTAEATAQPKSDKYTKAAEKWSQYGVTQTQAKSAVEKWDTLKGSYEGSRAVSEYRDWLGKQNLTGRQRFAMFSQANADLEKKATEFNKKYGTKYEALWNAYTKYNGESFHGEEYRSWVEKQTSDYYQRFALVEFAEPRSNWIEHAEELHKAGVSYKAVWEAARYAKNQSGRGKKDRIIAYAKKLGMTSKQAENIYNWFGK